MRVISAVATAALTTATAFTIAVPSASAGDQRQPSFSATHRTRQSRETP